MSHVKTIFSLLSAILFFSAEIKSSAEHQKIPLENLEQTWNRLRDQQALKTRTQNLINESANDCWAVFCLNALIGTSSFNPLLSNIFSENTIQCAKLKLFLFTGGLAAGCLTKTCKQECCIKPAQAKKGQEIAEQLIFQSYALDQIEDFFGKDHPIAVKARNNNNHPATKTSLQNPDHHKME